MLTRVLDVLADRGWFDTSAPFETSINFTQGACLWLLLTRQGVAQCYVKFSDRIGLALEARRCEAASRCYPQLVPAYVGYAHQDGLDVLVCRAVDFRGLNARQLQHGPVHGRIVDGLGSYFRLAAQTQLPADLTPLPNRGIVDALRAYFDPHPARALALHWLQGDAARLAQALPDMPQHSDLVLNNMGQTRQGTALLIDWEDFGASCLPGLDLFTLELSLAGDATRLLAARQSPAYALQGLVRDACAAMRLDEHDYRRLAPIHALVFRYLKRNYGPGVRDRFDRVLAELGQQAAGAAA